jgi:hypothetical protein
MMKPFGLASTGWDLLPSRVGSSRSPLPIKKRRFVLAIKSCGEGLRPKEDTDEVDLSPRSRNQSFGNAWQCLGPFVATVDVASTCSVPHASDHCQGGPYPISLKCRIPRLLESSNSCYKSSSFR